MTYRLLRLPPNLQYHGEDCEALAVTVGVRMNLVPISNKVAKIGTLFLSDLARIMAFLSDDCARLLEWIHSAGSFSDDSRYFGRKRFEPR